MPSRCCVNIYIGYGIDHALAAASSNRNGGSSGCRISTDMFSHVSNQSITQKPVARTHTGVANIEGLVSLPGMPPCHTQPPPRDKRYEQTTDRWIEKPIKIKYTGFSDTSGPANTSGGPPKLYKKH